MKQDSNKITLFNGLPRHSWYWLFVIVAFSALIHLISIINLDKLPQTSSLPFPKTVSAPSKVTVKVTQKPKAKEKDEQDDKMQRLLETPLAPTEKPKSASRLGAQDHATARETKISQQAPRPKAADPGAAGRDALPKAAQRSQPLPQGETQTAKMPEVLEARPKPLAKQKEMLLSPEGSVVAPRPLEDKPRNRYESLMPRSTEMAQQVQAGYQDYVDEEVEVGERVDLNTTNFRYLGYFTTIRKAFEMVWVYPSEAVQRGLQGEVKVEFTIQKDGKVSRIRVVASSGHRILDEAVVDALRAASPFSPLPSGMQKEKLTVVGSFRYVLTTYAGAM